MPRIRNSNIMYYADENAALATDGAVGIVTMSFILSAIVSGSLLEWFALLNTLSFLVHLPLLELYLPDLPELFFTTLIWVVTFDPYNTDSWTE